MKLTKALFAPLVMWVCTASAQTSSIDWDANPKLHKVSDAYAKESAVLISDKRLQQYVDDKKLGVVVITTNKRIVKVNDDKGVEMYNKIYIPIYNNVEILEMKARTIQPNGTVAYLPDSKIVEEEEKGVKYKKFALEGVEKGSEIEYFYKLKMGANFFGIERFQSSTTPFQEAEFILETPERLSFTVKGYNGFSVGKDTVVNGSRIVTATGKNIPALEDEKYAARDAYVQNVQFKLSYNLEKDKNVRLYDWNQLAKNVYSNYTAFTEKEIKAIDGFLKKANIAASLAEEEKIIVLEEFIKTNINVDKDGISEDADKLDQVVKTRVTSTNGINRLFIACMDNLKINWQIVFPSKRNETPLDEELENYRLVDDLIFYFPNTESFMEPGSLAMRYPFIEPFWTSTKGLFLKGTTIGNFKTAMASFEDIPMQPYEKSAHNMEVSLKFNEGMDSLILHSKQMLMGYGAMAYRPIFSFLPKDKQEDFTKEIIKSVAKSDHIENIKVGNSAMTDCFANKPLTIEGDITSADLIELAGNKILVKIGDVIGPQVQMYQEKPRQLPITIEYPHALDRDIKLTIPAGYQIKNLNDININIVDAKETMGFVSGYTLNGNELQIKIHEFYKKTDYDLTVFQEFQKVINASADFNKVVLVLEKK